MQIVDDTAMRLHVKPLDVFVKAHIHAGHHKPYQEGKEDYQTYLVIDQLPEFVVDFCLDVLAPRKEKSHGRTGTA